MRRFTHTHTHTICTQVPQAKEESKPGLNVIKLLSYLAEGSTQVFSAGKLWLPPQYAELSWSHCYPAELFLWPVAGDLAEKSLRESPSKSGTASTLALEGTSLPPASSPTPSSPKINHQNQILYPLLIRDWNSHWIPHMVQEDFYLKLRGKVRLKSRFFVHRM